MFNEITLDPEDWTEVRQTFHRAVDRCLDEMERVRDRPVWTPTPNSVKAKLTDRLPVCPTNLEDLFNFFERSVLPYGTGNTHPNFWGWVHGSGNVAGVLGEMLAAFQNCNVGGRDHIAVYVERQILEWCKQIFRFPQSSSGILTSGTSMGTLIALTVARNVSAGCDVGKVGLASLPKRLVGYTSREAHGCIAKTFELLGLGSEALRVIPVNSCFEMDISALAEQIVQDRADGYRPMAVIASAGTVNTGAIDDLTGIADLCETENLWLHVDGAFGGLAVLTPEFRLKLSAISRADSVAFDFHKWLHVPYDAGCVLLKDEAAHRASFSVRREYLAGLEEGLAGGDPWFCEYGPELSRGFRALKIWFTFKAYGIEAFSELISQNCRQARTLGETVKQTHTLELLAEVSLNIVLFRFVPSREMSNSLSETDLNALNREIVIRLQTEGIAAPSTTTIDGKTAIRVCLTNHRTRQSDLEALVAAVLRLGEIATVLQ